MKNFFQKISISLLVLSSFVFGGIIYASEQLPDSYTIYENQNTEFSIFPYYVKTNSKISENRSTDKSLSTVNLLNIFPIKNVTVNPSPKKYVVPCGVPFGAKIYTNGIIVIDNPNYNEQNVLKLTDTQKNKVLQKGDVILKVDNQAITSTNQFENIVNNCNGNELSLTVIRKNQEINLPLKPTLNENSHNYSAGIWVRDSSAGIGTMTFFNPENKMFAGLGHGICDIDTGDIVSVFRGSISNVSIMNTQKSTCGMPGELKGCFTDNRDLGEIYSNSETGIYGKLQCNVETDIEPLEIATKQNIKTGKAQIITTVDGNIPRFYNINIDSINYNVNSPTKNIKLTITDPELLEKTGGIVQGMSGSPIIQNNSLVGAITHVLVNDPTKGYAIFAETMFANSNKIFDSHNKNLD